MLDDLLVVGFDLETRREVHIGERPLEQWRALGYGRRETVVCFYCWRGIDAPVGSRSAAPVRPVPRPAGGEPVCDVCHRPLAESLVRYGRHILC